MDVLYFYNVLLMAKITALTPQKNDPRRWSIYLDGRFFIGCTEEQLAALDLHVEDELDASRLEEVREALGIAKVRDAALRYLARRNRSERETHDYLRRKKFEEQEIAATIAWLREKGYVNDQQFAEEWIKTRQQLAPRGKQRLLMELYQKGIARETAGEALKENVAAEDEAEAAYRAIVARKNRYRGMETLEIKRKIYNFLSYRGFSPDAVVAAWERFQAEL